MRTLFLLTFVAVLPLAGCFEPSEPICAYSCGPAGDCPFDYHCQLDNYCHKNGTPEDAACEFSDAAVPDEAVTTVGDLGDGGSFDGAPDSATHDAATD